MILIREKKVYQSSVFTIEYYDDDRLIQSETLDLKTTIYEHESGATYFLLYDKNMAPISDAFQFLNFELADQSLNSKEKALHALKFLYIYKGIRNIEFDAFTRNDITNLKNFLRGISPVGQTISFELLTHRNAVTINGYLSIFRSYFTYLGIENSYLLKKSSKQSRVDVPYIETGITVHKYLSNEGTPGLKTEVPRYISVEEFRDILNEVRKNYGRREEIIIRLMFQAGLRIGEVLGLTDDDVVVEEVEGEYVTVAYIRNRVSDRKDQKAKTCMNVISEKQYKSKDYNTPDYGYQKVIIPNDLFDIIDTYIEDEHVTARNHKSNNYYKCNIADRVRESEPYENANYYIFINSQGKPLSSHLWNTILRKIFIGVGITVDKGTKEHNLNHRFRHGYAMFNVQYLNVKEIELQRKLRHRNLTSVAVYYRPTLSDMVKLKTEFTNDLYNIIPELNLEV